MPSGFQWAVGENLAICENLVFTVILGNCALLSFCPAGPLCAHDSHLIFLVYLQFKFLYDKHALANKKLLGKLTCSPHGETFQKILLSVSKRKWFGTFLSLHGHLAHFKFSFLRAPPFNFRVWNLNKKKHALYQRNAHLVHFILALI